MKNICPRCHCLSVDRTTIAFAAYLIAEMVGVSGIIAAVVAGVAQAQRRRRVSLFDAELANISESTWSTIVFTLNALVFYF